MTPEFGSISKQAVIQKQMLEENGFTVSEIKTKTATFFKLILFINMVLRLRKSDVLHVHACSYWGFLPAFYGCIAKKITTRRMILTYHGGMLESFYKYFHFVINPVLKNVDLVTVPSEYLKDVFNKFGHRNVVIVRNIVDVNIVESGKLIKRKRIRPRFIVARSLEEIYNVENSILAFEEIVKKFPESQLSILGTGRLKKSLETLVKSRQIPNINFVGKVVHRRMINYYRLADIAINPTNFDNTPVSVLEAFACGLCVISTNVGGLKNIIDDKINGILVRPNSPKEILDMATFLLENQNLAVKMSRKAQEYIEEQYSYETIAKSLIDNAYS